MPRSGGTHSRALATDGTSPPRTRHRSTPRSRTKTEPPADAMEHWRGDRAGNRLRSYTAVRDARAAPLGLLLGIAVAASVCIGVRGQPLAVGSALALMLVAPGLGADVAFKLTADSRRLSTVVLLSISWDTFVGLLSAYSQRQNSTLLISLIAAPGVGGAAAALIRQGMHGARPAKPRPAKHRRSADGDVQSEEVTRDVALARQDIARLHGPAWLWAGSSAVALSLGLSFYAVARTRGQVIGSFGLLPRLGIPFILAVIVAAAITFAGIVLAQSAAVAIMGLAALAAEFGLPPALVATNFLGGWNYKHLGVIDLISSGQPLNDSHDLFQNWPGFFASAANLASISGKAPLTYANWGTLIFLALGAVGLYSIAQQLFPSEPAIAPIASAIFITTQWGGQLYFSPQSSAFAIAMLVFAVVLPVLLRGGQSKPKDQPRRAIFNFVARDWATPSDIRSVARLKSVELVAVACGCLSIIVTHQLTPYMVLVSLAPFMILGWVSPAWRLGYIGLAIVSVGYLFVHRNGIGNQSIFSGFSFSNAEGEPTGVTSAAQEFARTGARVVAILVWTGAVITTISYARRLGRIVVPMTFAFMPFTLVLFQNYGGEAIYRVWLFSSPWCALLIAKRLRDFVNKRTLLTALACAWCVPALLASAQATDFGMFPILYMSSQEVAASSWFYDNAPPGATLVLAFAAFPQRLNKNYVLHNVAQTVNEPDLTDDPGLDGSALDNMSAASIASYLRSNYGPTAYLAFSSSMDAENAYFGIVTPGTLQRTEQKLTASPLWSVAYSATGVSLLRLAPG
jgi:hypothetical protein